MNVNAMKAHPCASIAFLASMRGNYSLIMCFQVKLKGGIVLAPALKFAVGAQLARAKSRRREFTSRFWFLISK